MGPGVKTLVLMIADQVLLAAETSPQPVSFLKIFIVKCAQN